MSIDTDALMMTTIILIVILFCGSFDEPIVIENKIEYGKSSITPLYPYTPKEPVSPISDQTHLDIDYLINMETNQITQASLHSYDRRWKQENLTVNTHMHITVNTSNLLQPEIRSQAILNHEIMYLMTRNG